MIKRATWLSRLLPYWLTVFAASWVLVFYYLWNTEKANSVYNDTVQTKIFGLVKDQDILDWSGDLLGFIGPLLVAATLSALVLTKITLPSWRVSWVNKLFAVLRRFAIQEPESGVALFQKNQFGMGEPNFNLVAFWLIFLPGNVLFFTGIKSSLDYARDSEYKVDGDYTQVSLEYAAAVAGWVGTVLLSFFLIPVTRHSVLLVAMNWSPVHALRIHIWAGYLSFFYISLHGILLVVIWFKYRGGPIYRNFIPPMECWTETFPEESFCPVQIYNFTGLVAFAFFAILWGSSLHWFRRKWYRLFYILHVTCGSLALLASVWHYEFIAIYLIPSIVYYLSSTMPTLVQALASRFRGGVRIVKVVTLDDSDDVMEVHISTDPTSHAILQDDHQPCKFLKLCVPKISVVWHPFTVYSHPQDRKTLRFLFRSVGPFTKQLRNQLTAAERPVTLIDGFYRCGDRCQEALCHDHISLVAGGVAITPFISMIYSILKVLADHYVHMNTSAPEKEPELKSMTLIWVCREPGLLAFVKKHYLKDMAQKASLITGFHFKVKTFYTGKPSVVTGKYLYDRMSTASTEEIDGDKASTLSSSADLEEGGLPAKGHNMKVAPMMPATCYRMKAKYLSEESDSTSSASTEEIGGDKASTLSSSADLEEDGLPAKGHNMEVVRMMPGPCYRIKAKYLSEESDSTLTASMEEIGGDKASTLSSSADLEEGGSPAKGHNLEVAPMMSSICYRIKAKYLSEESDSTSSASTEEMLSSAADLKKGGLPAKGHNMELSRMMPARYSQIRWNLPYFVAFSGSIWLGFHFLFHRYNSSATSFTAMSEQTWITILVTVFYVVAAVIIEAAVLLFRKHWPAPRPDDFDVLSSSALADDLDVEVANSKIDVTDSFDIHEGRPCSEHVFADAFQAGAPGIFMCGPPAMINMVRVEARRENSILGLTRYALYEEAFEM